MRYENPPPTCTNGKPHDGTEPMKLLVKFVLDFSHARISFGKAAIKRSSSYLELISNFEQTFFVQSTFIRFMS